MLEDDVDPQSRRFVEVVDRNARRLLRLVGDLLFVAQVEAGKLSLDPSPVDLALLAAEAVEAAGPRAREREVGLTLDVERLPVVSGDSGRIAQAIDNLVSNALKFTPAGGRVDVVLRRRGGVALLEVRDTGMGIADEDQGRLFERFFRSSAATEQAVPGVGLGLTIVKAIVDAHGGRIGLESREGIGAAFTIELPLSETAGLAGSPLARETVA